jgi:hypothetical protein
MSDFLKSNSKAPYIIDLTQDSDDEHERSSLSESNDVWMSIDVGYKNLGFILLKGNNGLDWNVIDLDVKKFTAEGVVEAVKKSLDAVVTTMRSLLSESNRVRIVVERQLVAVKVFKVAMVDISLRSYLTGLGYSVETVDPRKVKAHHFQERPEGQTYKAGKRAAVKIVFNTGVLERFEQAKKKDDYVDCCLQALYARDVLTSIEE